MVQPFLNAKTCPCTNSGIKVQLTHEQQGFELCRPTVHGFFSQLTCTLQLTHAVQTHVVQGPTLHMWRVDWSYMHIFDYAEVSSPKPHIVQGLTVVIAS